MRRSLDKTDYEVFANSCDDIVKVCSDGSVLKTDPSGLSIVCSDASDVNNPDTSKFYSHENKMDILNYNYDENSNRAIADPAPPNDILQIYSVSYPMLAKSVSKQGIQSPTGESTNAFIFKRLTGELAKTVEIPEGFPSTDTLIRQINQAIVEAYTGVANPLRLQAIGESQARWKNDDSVNWEITYPNPETKQLLTGSISYPLNETLISLTSSDIFECDSRLGISQLELKLTNGQALSIPSTGKWLDHLLFSFNALPSVSFQANREIKMIAHYNSLRITKELICPRKDGIIISTN